MPRPRRARRPSRKVLEAVGGRDGRQPPAAAAAVRAAAAGAGLWPASSRRGAAAPAPLLVPVAAADVTLLPPGGSAGPSVRRARVSAGGIVRPRVPCPLPAGSSQSRRAGTARVALAPPSGLAPSLSHAVSGVFSSGGAGGPLPHCYGASPPAPPSPRSWGGCPWPLWNFRGTVP